jgi:hypothetical protein
MVQTLSMRMKLLMVAVVSLTVSVALMAVTADTANTQLPGGSVTEIMQVRNETNKEIYIWNHESGEYFEIEPGGTANFTEWVPWATTADEFLAGHYIEVGNVETLLECGGIGICPRFSFWQENRKSSGDRIRYTGQKPPNGPVQFRSDAKAMPGASTTGERRHLCVYNLGRVRPINISVKLIDGSSGWNKCGSPPPSLRTTPAL